MDGSATVTDFVYSYADGGGDTALRQSVDVLDAGSGDTHTVEYDYDARDRLVAAVTRDSSGGVVQDRSFGYDAAGNRTSTTVDGDTTSASFNAANQLTQSGSTTFTYDDAGNLTGTSDGSALGYNTADQTTTIRPDSSSGTDSAAYAGDGQFDRTSLGGATFDATLLGVTRRGGPDGQAYVRDPAGSLLGVRDGADRAYALTDALGSVVATTDSTGGVDQRFDYTPYGDTTATQGTIDTPWRFTGEYQDAATGMYKIGIRYYQPTHGRWTQPDPALSVAKADFANTYLYANACPTNYTDPTGAISKCALGGTALAVAGAITSGIAVPVILAGYIGTVFTAAAAAQAAVAIGAATSPFAIAGIVLGLFC